MTFLRAVCFFFMLTCAFGAKASQSGLVESERELQKSYEAAVAIVKQQQPSLLGALEDEQVDWLEFRNKYCKEANSHLPGNIDPTYAENYCKANMNRKRSNVLQGKHPSGKQEGKSF